MMEEGGTPAHRVATKRLQRHKLQHRSSDPQFTDFDMLDAVDMVEHAAWAQLDEPLYADKDFEIYRPPPVRSTLPVYYIKGWLPYSADALFNTITDIRYRSQWDKTAAEYRHIEKQKDSDVMYFAANLPWPFARRDYVYRRWTKYFAKQNAFVMICQTAHHADAIEVKDVVRVETFSLRMSIRSTGTNSCDFYIEYEDDTNFCIPNYVVNWLLSAQVPGFMTNLRMACANYAGFAKHLDEDGALLIPSVVLRRKLDSTGGQRVEHEISSSTASHDQVDTSSCADLLLASDRRAKSDAEGRSDHGTSSSSSDNSKRKRGLFRRNRSEQKSAKASSMKKVKSMGKLFSRNKTSSPRNASRPVKTTEITVDFFKHNIGLHLEVDVFTNHITVASCEKNSEAAANSSAIEIGMVIASVNGKRVAETDSQEVLRVLKESSRPLQIGFSHTSSNVKEKNRYKQPKNVSKFVVRHHATDLIRALQPLDSDTNCGAVLKIDFEAIPFTKKALQASAAGKASLIDESSTRSHVAQDSANTTVPEGYILYEIDYCCVVQSPFAEIVHLLSRNGDTKVISFKAALSVVGNQSDTQAPRSALSKRLSDMFRWRNTPDDSVTTVQDLHDEELWGELKASDPSSESSEPVTCLPDYTRVKISTPNLKWAWKHVHMLKTEERIFSAALLVEKIESFCQNTERTSEDSAIVRDVLMGMHEEREWINQIKYRRHIGTKALHGFNQDDQAEWLFGQTYFGVSTHWKPDTDGSTWIKLDTLIDGVDLMSTVAVMREIDLYASWLPWCNQSQLLHQAEHTDRICYLSFSFPFLRRDTVVQVVAINACYERRCLLAVGSSIDDSKIPSTINIPRTKRWNGDSMELRTIRMLIEPLGRRKARVSIVCNIDLRCSIPRSMLNFGVKKFAGVVLFLVRKEAEKIEKSHQEGSVSEHMHRLQTDTDGFYNWARSLTDRWFSDAEKDTLPAPIQLPKTSEFDLLLPYPSLSVTPSKSSRENPRHTSSPSIAMSPTYRASYTSKRSWSRQLLTCSIWPYVPLILFSGITPVNSFLSTCALKFIFTCASTWFSVPSVSNWQRRDSKRAKIQTDTLRRRCVLVAAILDLLNSWFLHLWVHSLMCYTSVSSANRSVCFDRSAMELRATENFWLLVSAFTFATVIAGIQLVVNF